MACFSLLPPLSALSILPTTTPTICLFNYAVSPCCWYSSHSLQAIYCSSLPDRAAQVICPLPGATCPLLPSAPGVSCWPSYSLGCNQYAHYSHFLIARPAGCGMHSFLFCHNHWEGNQRTQEHPLNMFCLFAFF